MKAASRIVRHGSMVGAAALLLFLFTAPPAAEAASGDRGRSRTSVSRKAVPRASAPSRTPATRHSPRSYGRSHGYRGHRSGGYRVGIGFGYSGYRGFGYYGYYPFSWGYWPLYFPYGHSYYPYPYPYRYSYGPDYAAATEVGAFDLNVKPKKAQVYLDGALVGTAAKFDGYPSYLWVSKGRHELVFYMPGYETTAQEVTALPGTVIDLRLRLERGESRPPEEVITYRPQPRPEERVAEAPDTRPRREARPMREPRAPAVDDLDLRGEPGRFQVTVVPGDASVYLDGRFLGTGDELSRLHAGLIVDPGEHQIEVVRPGYLSRTLDFEVAAGEGVELELSLEPTAGS